LISHKTIQNLKEENSELSLQLENYKNEIEELTKENKKLNEENELLENEKPKSK